MTTRIERVADLTTGSEVLSKINDNSVAGNCVGNNKCIYKFSGVSSTSPVVIPNAIPLKAPCAYCMIVKFNIQNGAGSIVVQYSVVGIGQAISGGAIVQTASTLFAQPPGPPTSTVTLAKNALRDTLDITIVLAVGGTQTYSLEFDIFNVTSF